MLPYLSNTLSFVNLDYRCTNLPSYYIESSILHKFLDQYAHPYKNVILNLPSYYIEPSILHKFLDQYAHPYKNVILIWSFYMVLDQYAPPD
jgi:hypothetical protein